MTISLSTDSIVKISRFSDDPLIRKEDQVVFSSDRGLQHQIFALSLLESPFDRFLRKILHDLQIGVNGVLLATVQKKR